MLATTVTPLRRGLKFAAPKGSVVNECSHFSTMRWQRFEILSFSSYLVAEAGADDVKWRGMKPVLFLMAPGFEEIEFCAPVDILRRLDIPVTTAGVQGRRVEGAHGIVMQADMLLVDVDSAMYSGVVLPGGAASWTLRDTPGVLRLVREIQAAGKLVAAICAAPIALEAAGVINNRRITCYPAEDVTKDITTASAISDAPTETDGNLITGRGPGAALEFGFALAAYFCPQDKTDALRQAMCLP